MYFTPTNSEVRTKAGFWLTNRIQESDPSDHRNVFISTLNLKISLFLENVVVFLDLCIHSFLALWNFWNPVCGVCFSLLLLKPCSIFKILLQHYFMFSRYSYIIILTLQQPNSKINLVNDKICDKIWKQMNIANLKRWNWCSDGK